MLVIVALAGLYGANGDGTFCEYDIMIPEGDRGRRALIPNERLWDEGVVPYMYAAEVPMSLRRNVERAMLKLEEVADISFVLALRPKGAHLIVTTRYMMNGKTNGCWATVGKHAPARMNLGWCSGQKELVHELLHVLGMWHEQSRPDAPTYLSPRPMGEGSSDINDCIIGEVRTRGMPYDFRSIMHYPINFLGATLTEEGRNRLTAQKTQAARVGYYLEMSRLDVMGLQELYGRSNGASRRDTENSAVAGGLIGGGIAIAVLGMVLALY